MQPILYSWAATKTGKNIARNLGWYDLKDIELFKQAIKTVGSEAWTNTDGAPEGHFGLYSYEGMDESNMWAEMQRLRAARSE